jgi:hypothetical protein
MSSTLPPSPPPPPPQHPVAPASPTIDFAAPFTFVFRDPDWVVKILIGGLVYIAAFLLIGIPFLAGYSAMLIRRVVAGLEPALPEWSEPGTLFVDGMKVIVVGIVYSLPMILFAILMVVAGVIGGDGAAEAAIGCMALLFLPLLLVIYFFLPAAMVRMIVTGEISAAFDFPEVFGLVRRNIVNYLLAFVIYLIANFISQFGILLLCIGVIFTAFWSMLVTTYAFADVYRLDRAK